MSGEFWLGIGTIVATFLGPVLAVIVTREVDRRRDVSRRRLELFRLLMRSRRTPLSVDFVTGLNLIEVEFYGQKAVLDAWRALWDDLNDSRASSAEEDRRIAQRREYLRAILLSQMAKTLGLSIPDLEIFKGGYNPEGHAVIEAEQSINRRFFADIAKGVRTFPVSIVPPPSPPPAPPSSAKEVP